jgi:hypothetical protein
MTKKSDPRKIRFSFERLEKFLIREQEHRDDRGHPLASTYRIECPADIDKLGLPTGLVSAVRRAVQKPEDIPIVQCAVNSASGGVGVSSGNPEDIPISTSRLPSTGQDIKQIVHNTLQSRVSGDSSAVPSVGISSGKNYTPEAEPPDLVQLRKNLALMEKMVVSDRANRAMYETTAEAIRRQIAKREKQA